MAFTKVMRDFHREVNSSGFALGRRDVKSGEITFRYGKKAHTVSPSFVLYKTVRNGTFYELPVRQFKQLKEGT